MVKIFGSLFNRTPIGHASDSMIGATISKSIYLTSFGLYLVLSVTLTFGVQLVVFICPGFSVVFSFKLIFSRSDNTLFLSNLRFFTRLGLYS